MLSEHDVLRSVIMFCIGLLPSFLVGTWKGPLAGFLAGIIAVSIAVAVLVVFKL